MEEFFAKHPMPYTEKDALDLMHANICAVKKSYIDNPEGMEYLTGLSGVDSMIKDFFDAKKLIIDNYKPTV